MTETPDASSATKPQSDPRENTVDFAAVTKYGAVSAALSYATGMITINTYLHKLGVSDFSFARPKLILTGVLVLLTFLLLSLLPVSVAWRMAANRSLRPHSWHMLVLLLLPLLALFGAAAFLCFQPLPGMGEITVWAVWSLFKERTVGVESLESLIVAAMVYIPICVAAISAFGAARLYRQMQLKATRPHGVPERIYYPIVLSLAVIAIVGYVCIFALTFYAAIPEAFGGGKPYFQSFLIADEGRCPLLQLGIPFADQQPNITRALPVIHESDTLIAVWLGPAKTGASSANTSANAKHWSPMVVQLDKKLISATMEGTAETMPPRMNGPAPCNAASPPAATQPK